MVHLWRVWRTRVPDKPVSCGDDWGFGTTGVREPRRPLPGLGGDTVALDPRDDVRRPPRRTSDPRRSASP